LLGFSKGSPSTSSFVASDTQEGSSVDTVQKIMAKVYAIEFNHVSELV
jgi:hypothetical protein